MCIVMSGNMDLVMTVQSGKLVQKMFQKIQELIDDSDAFICVLIDEVTKPHPLPIQL